MLKQVRKDINSPNFDQIVIPVEFIVIHYTACSLKRTLEILTNQERKVSAHLVIDKDGSIFEIVNCLDGAPKRAWHSGPSTWRDKDNKTWQTFNDFAIGIELVNENGNIFNYTDAQYQSLQDVITLLQSQHLALKESVRVIGHEQIAGYRGKSDPGVCFDWERILNATYPSILHTVRYKPRLTQEIQKSLEVLAKYAPTDEASRDIFFSGLSMAVEGLVL